MVEPNGNASPDAKHLYEERYSGNYMDTDAFSIWGRGDIEARRVADALRVVQGQPERVLDYGCGVGGWIGLLAKTFPVAAIDGIDVSENAIGKAAARFPQYGFEVFDGLRAPFEDEAFDLVFSFHVLEHVGDVDASARDIWRMLKHGGWAVIIYPCGNEGSFLDRVMNRMKDSKLPTADGRSVLFFEVGDGHLRRMTSAETEALFAQNGAECVARMFSGHFFGTMDWLCRGTGPAYINRLFSGRPPKSGWARIQLELLRRFFLGIHRLIQRRSVDLTKRRAPLKQAAAIVIKWAAEVADGLIRGLSALEWRFFKHRPSGTAQYLVFQKP